MPTNAKPTIMNVYGAVDYQQPLGRQNDMRTSTYRGHRYMTDTMLGIKMHAKFGESRRNYNDDPLLSSQRISDYQAHYVWKYGDPDEKRNPPLDRKVLYIKPFEECKMRFIKRPLRPASSVSQQDYTWSPIMPVEPPPPIAMPSEVGTTKVTINRAKPGYAKLLDSAATTMRLSYVAYSPDELMSSVAAHDNITFWNWNTLQPSSKRVWRERDETMCDNKAAKECPKRRCEFPSSVKHVPNKGLVTEVRENYLEPHTRAMDVDTTYIRNRQVHVPFEPSVKKTEYNIYGSGERTQQHV